VRTSPWLREILTLDPEREAQRIVRIDTVYEFPFDTTRSLEFALFRTFASPAVSRLLDETQEFALRAQRRYDDTDLILSTIVESGYDSDEGKRAVRRMNRLHGRFDIANEDFLYVLSTFVYEPIRWNARFGWRRFVEQERLAWFHHWREVGRRMAIKEIPSTFEEFERYNLEYERANFHFAESNARVARASRDMFLAWFPGLPKRLGAHVIAALMDDRLREAIGFPQPPRAIARFVDAALRGRAQALRLMPPRRKPKLRTQLRHRTYRDGYVIEALGPMPPDAV
jgi:ER-bound oxygenase mpaB/B'/Rubber oxygenase, catalytic domain